jgi:hypothetical protein
VVSDRSILQLKDYILKLLPVFPQKGLTAQ